MTDVQIDFINTVKRYDPFVAEYDQLTDAITYALNVSENDGDNCWTSIIDGKKFIWTEKGSRWGGKCLT